MIVSCRLLFFGPPCTRSALIKPVRDATYLSRKYIIGLRVTKPTRLHTLSLLTDTVLNPNVTEAILGGGLVENLFVCTYLTRRSHYEVDADGCAIQIDIDTNVDKKAA